MSTSRQIAHARDLVVIGCSAGGVEALPRILIQLPPELKASVYIVQHLAPTSDPYLIGILQRSSRLPVSWAEQGELPRHGHVYVAPPDLHLLFNNEHLRLARTARENHSRPSIDKLFRSAAAVHGSRLIGVLLTGMLDDGVAGLRAIREAGGIVIVQDPADAAFADLPRNALRALEPDRVLAIHAIGTAITSLVGEVVPAAATPRAVAVEAGMDLSGPVPIQAMAELGPQTTFSCPDCRGPMWEVGDEQTRRYRCYLGHVVTAQVLIEQTDTQIESALWSAVRALNDRASTLETLAADAGRIGNGWSAEAYAVRAREAREQSELARQFMFDLVRLR